MTKRYYIFIALVAVISLVGFTDNSKTPTQQLATVFQWNIGPHLLYVMIYQGIKFQLNFLSRKSTVIYIYKSMMKPFSWALMIIGAVIVPIKIISSITNSDLSQLGICSVGMALFLGGYDLNLYLRKNNLD